MRFAPGTSLTLEADYTAKTLVGFPSVSGNLRIDEAFVVDGEMTPGRLSVNGTLTFGPQAVLDVVNAESFASKRRVYSADYVIAEAESVVGCPVVAPALRDDGWKVSVNESGTQVILSRPRGLMMVVR